MQEDSTSVLFSIVQLQQIHRLFTVYEVNDMHGLQQTQA